MVRLKLDIVLDSDGRLLAVYRRCNIERPICEGCLFQATCQKAEDAVIKALGGLK